MNNCEGTPVSYFVPNGSYIDHCALEGTITPDVCIEITDLGPC